MSSNERALQAKLDDQIVMNNTLRQQLVRGVALRLVLLLAQLSCPVFMQAARDPTYRHNASAAADRATIESLQRQLAQQTALSKELQSGQ